MPVDSTVEDLDQLHRQARTARARLEPIWYLNLAYMVGEQWVAWDGRQLYRPQMPKSRITVVENVIQPAVRTEIAKLTRNHPVFTVTPRSADEEDRNAADLGDQVMRYLWKHLTLHELSSKALLWSRITGAGFLKCFWDSSIGDSVEVLVGQSGNVLTGQGGGPIRPGSAEGQLAQSMQAVVREVSQGDMRVEVRSPFQMFVDPIADTFDEAEWLIEESVKSADYVRRMYKKDIQPDTPANAGLVEARMGSVFMPGAGGYKGVKVREYWAKPSSKHPNGRRAVWCKDQILLEDEPFDPCPYVMLSGIPIPGRLWPTSIVEQLRGPQTELNKALSQIAENCNRLGNPTILASKQAVQDPDKFVQSMTVPGGVYFFDDIGSQNAVPQVLQAPPLPEYVIERLNQIRQAIEDISGQHEVTQAQVPPGVTAASAINLLQEADETRLGPAVDDFEQQLAKLGQKLLKLVARYYTDARTIRIAGDNAAFEVFDFRGTMLRDNTQVEVQTGSAFPHSKAAKQAAMQELLTFFVQSGNPPHGRQLAQFLQDWEVGGAERLIADYTADETQANRENALMLQGQPMNVNDYDNDEAHLDNHQTFQKQARYQTLPPQVQQIIEAHVALHRQRLDQQQQQQMMQQMMMEGKPLPGQDDQQQQQEMQMQQQQQQMQMQGQAQQQQSQAAQAAQQAGIKDQQTAQQLGHQQAQTAKQQQQADELHQQKLRHAEEQHQAKLHQMREQSRVQAEAARRQAQNQRGEKR